MTKLLGLFAIGALFVLVGCNGPRVAYDTFQDLKGNIWHTDSLGVFTFEVNDAAMSYDVAYKLRNSLEYPFFNLYVSYELQGEDSSVVAQVQKHETLLMDPKTGRPLGKGIGDLYEHEVLLLEDFRFPAAGSYTLQLRQFMRPDSLPAIHAIGLRVVQHIPQQ